MRTVRSFCRVCTSVCGILVDAGMERRARVPHDELVAAGRAAADDVHALPAPWVEDHVARLGGWRLAPQLLVDQLAALSSNPLPALVMVPRRQVRKLNSQFGYLGDPPKVVVHPDDAAAAGVADGAPMTVRSARGELTGVARVDPAVRPEAISVPTATRPPTPTSSPAWPTTRASPSPSSP